VSALPLIVGIGCGCVAAWAAGARSKLADTVSRAESPTLREAVPDDAFPSRADQVEAVQALCFSSEPYVLARLAAYEPEVSDLAELVLELDDQAPKPSGPNED